MRMAFVGKYERMTAQRAYELGMISQIVDPPERLREEAQELAEKIARELARGDGRDEARAVGRARAGPHRRVPGRRAASWSRCGATPTRKKAPARSPRSARRVWLPLEPRRPVSSLADLLFDRPDADRDDVLVDD